MILEVIAGAALGIGGLLLVALHLKTRGQLRQANTTVADTLNRALAAEREKARAEAELDFLQKAIVTQLQRPVMAALTDAHIHEICQTVAQLVISYITPKEKLN